MTIEIKNKFTVITADTGVTVKRPNHSFQGITGSSEVSSL